MTLAIYEVYKHGLVDGVDFFLYLLRVLESSSLDFFDNSVRVDQKGCGYSSNFVEVFGLMLWVQQDRKQETADFVGVSAFNVFNASRSVFCFIDANGDYS